MKRRHLLTAATTIGVALLSGSLAGCGSHKVMLNKARMHKFGVHLGDVTLSFRKR